MRSKFLLIALALGAGGLQLHTRRDLADRGVAAVNVPVVTSADYVFDAAAPGGALAPGESRAPQRLVPGPRPRLRRHRSTSTAPYADAARDQVAQIAGSYGMMVSAGAPVTAGVVQPGSVRVVVSRRRAEVPGCPNWSRPSQPDYDNRTMSNFGCGGELQPRRDGRQS